jgi:hypothetical protein
MAKAVNQKIINAKNAKDQAHNDSTALFEILPTYLLGPLGTIASYISQNVGLTIAPLKVRGN